MVMDVQSRVTVFIQRDVIEGLVSVSVKLVITEIGKQGTENMTIGLDEREKWLIYVTPLVFYSYQVLRGSRVSPKKFSLSNINRTSRVLTV